MPNYEFVCQECDKQYSFKVSYKDLQKLNPVCDCGSPLSRIMSLANMVKKISKPSKTGQVTENSIKEFKEDLERQKKDLKDKNK